jgi:hypothetical protein
MAIEKIVCFDCATEPYLRRQIQRKGTSAPCSLCGNERKCVPLSKITAQVEKVLGSYICEGDYMPRWTSDGARDVQEGEDAVYWISEIFDCDTIVPIVQEVYRDLACYNNDTNYVRLPFIPNNAGHQWCEFQEGMTHGNRYFNDSARKFLGWLFEGVDSYSASSEENSVVRLLTPDNAAPFFRARACSGHEDVEVICADPARNLGAPPKAKAGEGRMNPAGVPAFYGAFDRDTCVAELRPRVGSDVVSGEFRLNADVRVLDFGRLESADLGPSPSCFDPKYFEKTGRQEFLRYLHNEITAPVNPGNQRSYLITQVIAEYLATHYVPRFDGVIFKSVQKEGGQNLVLFSHVACEATSMTWPVSGGYHLRGRKASDAPRIEYVNGSLIKHTIRGVVFGTDEYMLPETPSAAEPQPVFDF